MAEVVYEVGRILGAGEVTGNPAAQGLKQLRHGSISDLGLSDLEDTTDTEPLRGKAYIVSVKRTTTKRKGSAKRAIDDSGARGGGAADTAAAAANRSKLLERGFDFIKHNYKPESFEATIKAIDLHLLDPTVDTIELGDVVKIVLPSAEEKKGTCVKIQYDLMAPENTEYTVGDAEKAIG